MCDNHEQRELPAWLMDAVLLIRCLPPLGVHERCEHDLGRRPPTFERFEPHWAIADPASGRLLDTAETRRAVRWPG